MDEIFSERIMQPCIEGMCYRKNDKAGVYEYCDDVRHVEHKRLIRFMPGVFPPVNPVCRCYAYPASWHRQGGCPRCTLKYNITKPDDIKKVNPIKASKRSKS